MGGTVRLITRQADLNTSYGAADAQLNHIHEGGSASIIRSAITCR